MIQLICDRCGKKAGHLYKLSWKRVAWANPERGTLVKDLCPNCITLLKEFVNEYKPK